MELDISEIHLPFITIENKSKPTTKACYLKKNYHDRRISIENTETDSIEEKFDIDGRHQKPAQGTGR